MSRLLNPYRRFLAELKAARVARDMTQGQLASKIKLSRAQYTAIENGRCVVNYTHIHNLSAALKVRFTVGDASFPPSTQFVDR